MKKTISVLMAAAMLASSAAAFSTFADATEGAGGEEATYSDKVLNCGKYIPEIDGEIDEEAFKAYREKFEAALCDDLNSSMAITVLYDMLKADISDATKYALAESFDYVLSLDLTTAHAQKEEDNSVDAELESYVLQKIEERKAAKKEKDFAKADAIRDDLLAKGIVLKDTREGVIWHKA